LAKALTRDRRARREAPAAAASVCPDREYGAASRASSSGEREIADIGAAFDFLRLVERQHVERGIALDDIFDVIFQQRADDEGGAILLTCASS
jgi:hypothetical protein